LEYRIDGQLNIGNWPNIDEKLKISVPVLKIWYRSVYGLRSRHAQE